MSKKFEENNRLVAIICDEKIGDEIKTQAWEDIKALGLGKDIRQLKEILSVVGYKHPVGIEVHQMLGNLGGIESLNPEEDHTARLLGEFLSLL
ncbi:MAG: hypothetical protein COX80_02255 [Candidatus Magasanikbacteria bacterium CG_4_10_14_0_2_um_filter_33_14]|uniref:Uncharacterized protein n=1 Tax=Candidatus Magasanikbacteria bacterium CG_4_10_14_0_2_um_filter_33_14 TaxID=1974636 RepID=A0A2M7VAZ8_9BACT|nr:MAG: hypothetical protein COX80_02255 [Candidatus Magasanikbacteria bacterium CG_4_10_14_0_2_um_filter_33_14]